MRAVRVVAVAFLVVAGLPLYAGETGSVSGVVKDSQGGVLPGVPVKVSGAQLPGGREAVSSQSGTYLFPRLLPGVYRVEASLSGMGTAAREVRVSIDVDSQVDLVLSPTVTEEVTVTAMASAVDLKHTEVNFNYGSDEIGVLPLERTYRGLFQLIPGVADNRSTVGPSAGGSRQDNTYLIDGVNITNPGFGYLATEVNELDVAEFNVKRGAITAEFGRAAGVVANAVSKSGTNDINGAVRLDWQPEGLVSGFTDDRFRDPLLTTNLSPAVAIGGPFVKNKLFWYGSARYFENVRWDRENRLAEPLPDEERKGHELFGKITATPNQKHLVNVSFRDRPNDVNGSFGTVTSDKSPTVATTDDNSARIATAAWSFFATDRTVFEAKYLYLKERNEANPDNELGYLPPFNAADPAQSGYYLDPARQNVRGGAGEYFQDTNYTRHEARAVLSQFLDIGRTTHQIKAGVGYEFGEEDFFRLTNGWGDIQRITVSGAPVLRARYYFEQPPQLGQGRTWSLFLQDTMTVSSRLTLNLGVLLNKDEFAQDLAGSGGCPTVNTIDGQPGGAAVFESSGDRCTFIRYGFGEQVQPRLGFNFNVREGKGDKLYANWGKYYNTDQKSSGRSLAPRRIFQREARFNAVTGALISDLPRAATTGKLVDKDLKPTYNIEWLAGYATPVGADWSVDLFFVYRDTSDFIEDVPSVLQDSGNPNFSFPYAAANLPCSTFRACQGADAERTYKAFTVDVARRLKDRWAVNASYTWSRLEGNFDLDYASGAVFNTSSFIQDGPGTYIEEPFRDGVLREDRPHVFKLFANYEPTSALTLGSYLRVQSGTPWNARGQDTQGGAALYYLEAAGAHRNPTWTNLDLLASYRFELSSRVRLTLQGRVLNVFNTQTRTSTDSVQFLDSVTISTPPGIAPGTRPNAFFGTGNGFAPPLRFVVGALLSF
jgi:hypothetical protein